LEIIPVMDILNGTVVHAIKGIRSKYKPIKSVLSTSANPLEVAMAFRSRGFNKLYIADLDAIMGKEINFAILRQIRDKTGLELWVDAGFNELKRAEEALKNGVSKIIIGTETLPSLNFLKKAIRLFGKEKIVVSMDLRNRTIISRFMLDDHNDHASLLREFWKMGILQIIVLDLARVGSENGIEIPILKETLKNPGIRVFAGGGVRDTNDLLELKDIGVSGVLLATALHSGRIPVKELRRKKLL
jgi:phosphoribosylformimino-5-aminoimidazole carboxamide ribotide isomerase